MAPSPAPAARAALDQMTLLRPQRSRISDGIMSSNTHKLQNPNSDHDLGNAFDLTHDPKGGVDAHDAADWMRLRCKAGLEKRVKYIISNGRIASGTYKATFWTWRKYSGPNPHTKHAHFSLWATRRNQTQAWWAGFFTKTPAVVVSKPSSLPVVELHNLGMRKKNGDVLVVQKALNAEVRDGRLRGVDFLKQDAIWGTSTRAAISQFQQQVQGWRAIRSPGNPVPATMTVLAKRRGFDFKAS